MNKNMKKALPATICLMTFMASSAAPLTPREALDAALGETPMRLSSESKKAQAYHLSWATPDSCVYVFNRQDAGHGFIVAAGDSDFPASLLGYSDTGAFDPSDMPPAMEWLLGEFSAGRFEASPLHARRASIAPLVKTIWNQSAPFNNDCPMDNNKRSVTGCMATAMAQVLNFWQHPAVGTGTATATTKTDKKSYVFDFSAHPFDWENMLDSYNGIYNDTQAAAVANLMYGCGAATAMDYSSDESSATAIAAWAGLIDNLGYDKSLVFLHRDFYDLPTWNTMVYDELSAGRPLIYTGQGPAGGHAFVCDGYDGSAGEFFHINWGWGGQSDGYFLLTNLSPGTLGIGGGGGGFNSSQIVSFNLMPAQADSDYIPVFGCEGYFASGATSYKRTDFVLFECLQAESGESYGIFNLGVSTITAGLGVKLTDTATGDVKYLGWSQSDEAIDSYSGFRGFYVSGKSFPESGEYIVTPAVRHNEEWHDIPYVVHTKSRVTVTISGNTLTFNCVTDEATLNLKSMTIEPTDIVAGARSRIVAELTAENGEYIETLFPILASNNTVIAQMSSIPVDIPEGETQTIEWNSVFSPTPAVGTYEVYLAFIKNNQCYIMHDPYTAKVIKATINDTPEIVSLAIKTNTQAASPSRADGVTEVVKGSPMNLEAEVRSSSGRYIGNLTPLIFYSTDATSDMTLCEPRFTDIANGATGNVTFTGSIDHLDTNHTYYTALFTTDASNHTKQVGNALAFVPVEDTSSLDTLGEEGASAPVVYYTLQGVKIANPMAGHIYIRRQGPEATKIRF